MSVRKITSVLSSVKVVCVKFSITIMINPKIMNKIFDTPAIPLFMPESRFVIMVASVPLYEFDCLESAKRVFDKILDFDPLVAVSLVVNVKHGDNKETSDV